MQRHLKFSDVFGQISSKSSRITRPAEGKWSNSIELNEYLFILELPDLSLTVISKKHRIRLILAIINQLGMLATIDTRCVYKLKPLPSCSNNEVNRRRYWIQQPVSVSLVIRCHLRSLNFFSRSAHSTQIDHYSSLFCWWNYFTIRLWNNSITNIRIKIACHTIPI